MIGHTDGDMKFSGFLSCGQWYRYVGKWIPESDRHHLDVKTPTHWLPIPDLPKLSEQEQPIDWYKELEINVAAIDGRTQAFAIRLSDLETTVAAMQSDLPKAEPRLPRCPWCERELSIGLVNAQHSRYTNWACPNCGGRIRGEIILNRRDYQ